MIKATKHTAKKSVSVKPKSKSDQVVGLLVRPTGATIAEMMRSTSWQAHSVRGFLAGSLKKKGYYVSSKLDGVGVRHYHLDVRVSP